MERVPYSIFVYLKFRQQMKYRILYIEDEEHLASIVSETLEIKGYEVQYHKEGTRILEQINSFQPHICILDIMLPYIDGYSLGKTIRQTYSKLPIIFLTAKSQTKDIVAGFSSGGTDYIKKPFSLEELIVRIENQVAIHYANTNSNPARSVTQGIHLGSFKYTPQQMKLCLKDKEIRLSNRESELLNIFCLSANEPVDRRELMKMIWGDDSYFISRNLDVYIRRLREYFALGSGVEIITLKGKGYLFSVSDRNE